MKKLCCSWIIAVPILVIISLSNASAQMPSQGFRSLSLQLGGRTVTCSSNGQPIVWVADYSLQDSGHTLPDFVTVVYNPRVLSGLPGVLQLLIMGHECGHAYNRDSNESNADCWSIQKGAQQGWFSASDFGALAQLFRDNRGDMNHPPGEVRIANMQRCFDEAMGQSRGGARHQEDDAEEVDADPEASQCARTDSARNDIVWHKTNDDPTVDYKYGYRNTCDKPVRCTIKVAVGNLPRSSSNYDGWEMVDQKTRQLLIPANDSRTVSGTLTWDVNKPPRMMPSLRHSSQRDDDDDWKLSCGYAAQ